MRTKHRTQLRKWRAELSTQVEYERELSQSEEKNKNAAEEVSMNVSYNCPIAEDVNVWSYVKMGSGVYLENFPETSHRPQNLPPIPKHPNGMGWSILSILNNKCGQFCTNAV